MWHDVPGCLKCPFPNSYSETSGFNVEIVDEEEEKLRHSEELIPLEIEGKLRKRIEKRDVGEI